MSRHLKSRRYDNFAANLKAILRRILRSFVNRATD